MQYKSRSFDPAQLVQTWMDAYAFTPADVAKLADLEESAVVALLSGQASLDARSAAALANAMGLDDEARARLSQVAGWDGASAEPPPAPQPHAPPWRQPLIWAFDEFTTYLPEWKRRNPEAYKAFESENFLGDGGMWANLVARRRQFTEELQQSFARHARLSRAEAAHLKLLVRWLEAQDYETSCNTTRVSKRKARVADEEATRKASAEGRKLATRRAEEAALERRRLSLVNAERKANAAHNEAKEALEQARLAVRASVLIHTSPRCPEVATSLLAATITELARCPGFRLDARAIAAQITWDPPSDEVSRVLGLLLRAGALVVRADGAVEVRQEAFIIGDDDEVPRDAVHRYYVEVMRELDRGVGALWSTRDAHELTELGAVTMALPRSELPRFQHMLRRFREQVTASATALETAPEQVFQLVLYLGPVTRAGG